MKIKHFKYDKGREKLMFTPFIKSNNNHINPSFRIQSNCKNENYQKQLTFQDTWVNFNSNQSPTIEYKLKKVRT